MSYYSGDIKKVSLYSNRINAYDALYMTIALVRQLMACDAPRPKINQVEN